ncbi:protein phosphatase 2C-related protein [Heterostelium album PN500]|uniref:Protein phosphatase 2C-related protein n=1 Tax=Heterostelium pallidum (strain ATCC 26659 / Pp 5 / PN500) TaxID=670386 RepID=D3BNX9_HETP5|nr:protein phosphatase 2C-related protein [Heterostelium album PN500]EFA76898.1 protein phosphatase 2C-related protein [Heterostelium album PN500]|eukprot:XP_020429030.1 protein phosphatase 2C-related protein [Heterostelium album PN500]
MVTVEAEESEMHTQSTQQQQVQITPQQKLDRLGQILGHLQRLKSDSSDSYTYFDKAINIAKNLDCVSLKPLLYNIITCLDSLEEYLKFRNLLLDNAAASIESFGGRVSRLIESGCSSNDLTLVLMTQDHMNTYRDLATSMLTNQLYNTTNDNLDSPSKIMEKLFKKIEQIIATLRSIFENKDYFNENTTSIDDLTYYCSELFKLFEIGIETNKPLLMNLYKTAETYLNNHRIIIEHIEYRSLFEKISTYAQHNLNEFILLVLSKEQSNQQDKLKFLKLAAFNLKCQTTFYKIFSINFLSLGVYVQFLVKTLQSSFVFSHLPPLSQLKPDDVENVKKLMPNYEEAFQLLMQSHGESVINHMFPWIDKLYQDQPISVASKNQIISLSNSTTTTTTTTSSSSSSPLLFGKLNNYTSMIDWTCQYIIEQLKSLATKYLENIEDILDCYNIILSIYLSNTSYQDMLYNKLVNEYLEKNNYLIRPILPMLFFESFEKSNDVSLSTTVKSLVEDKLIPQLLKLISQNLESQSFDCLENILLLLDSIHFKYPLHVKTQIITEYMNQLNSLSLTKPNNKPNTIESLLLSKLSSLATSILPSQLPNLIFSISNMGDIIFNAIELNYLLLSLLKAGLYEQLDKHSIEPTVSSLQRIFSKQAPLVNNSLFYHLLQYAYSKHFMMRSLPSPVPSELRLTDRKIFPIPTIPLPDDDLNNLHQECLNRYINSFEKDLSKFIITPDNYNGNQNQKQQQMNNNNNNNNQKNFYYNNNKNNGNVKSQMDLMSPKSSFINQQRICADSIECMKKDAQQFFDAIDSNSIDRLQQCRQKCSSNTASTIRNSNTTYTASNNSYSNNSNIFNNTYRHQHQHFKGHRFFSSSFSSRYHQQHQQQQHQQQQNNNYYYRTNQNKYERQQNNSNSTNDKTKLKTLGVLLSPTFLLSSNSTNLPTVAPDVEPSTTATETTTSSSNNILKGLFNNNNTSASSESLNSTSDSMGDQATLNTTEDDQQESLAVAIEDVRQVDIQSEETAADVLDQFHETAVDDASSENAKQILMAAAIQHPTSNHSSESAAELTNNNADDDENKINNADLHFHSGICVIPHPNKRHKGGEDAHFISNDRRVLGVADGVGGWGDVGIDPSLYSNTLMEGSKLATNDNESRHPVDIMEKGYNYSQDIKGSSTCCIVVLNENSQLLSANLGDSGFLVIRRNEVHFRTREQQHAFNMPFQLGTQSIDRPIHSITSAFEVEEGDIIVLGTDGVFDNLFDDEICRITCKHRSEPQMIARMIAKRAYEVGNSTTIFTPFAKNAGLNGYIYSGGKLDDITVIVGVVAKGPIQPLKSDVLLLDEDFMGDDESL